MKVAFENAAEAMRGIILIAEREEDGEIISDEETNPLWGKLSVSLMRINQIVR